MNNSRIHIANTVLHFNKWSRKSYAVFASLGLSVVIGQLSTDVEQWLSDVNGQIAIQEELYLKIADENDPDNDDEQLMVELLAVVATSNEGCGKSINNKQNITAVKCLCV